MAYETISLKVGAARPFRALHISDTHLLFADGRDNEVKFQIAQRRYGEYVYKNVGRNMPYFLDALQYAKDHCDLMLHTGDLIDFVSLQNLEVASKLFKLAGVDYFMCAGNHEYTHYSGQHPETEEERQSGRRLVPEYFKNDLFFDSRVIHGVNFLAVDNGDYQFTRRQTELLKENLERGLPIVLLIHNPICSPVLADKMARDGEGLSLALCACSEDVMTRYAHRNPMAPNAETAEFLEILRSSGLVKAVLAGHVHLRDNFRAPVWGDVMQYIAGGGYYGCGEVFDFC